MYSSIGYVPPIERDPGKDPEPCHGSLHAHVDALDWLQDSEYRAHMGLHMNTRGPNTCSGISLLFPAGSRRICWWRLRQHESNFVAL